MRLQKVVTDFRKLRDAEIIPVCEFIIECMENNPEYAEPIPKITILQSLVDSYATALTDAASRDRNKIAVKNSLRLQLNATLNQLGNYVNTQGNGNVTTLISSGFALAKQPQPRYVTVPENFTVKAGMNAGTIACKLKADKAATGYTYMLAAAPVTENSIWTTINTSRSQCEFQNLEQRKDYVLKVGVIGSKDQVAYSKAINFFLV